MKKILIAIIAVSTIASAAMADHHEGMKDKMHKGMGIGKIMKDLPSDKQEQIKAIMEKNSNKEKMQSLKEKRKQIISADKFDKNAYIANVKAMEGLRKQAKENRIETQAEILSILTPEQRMEMLKSWDKGDRKRSDKKKK